MPNSPKDVAGKLDRLLRESAELRERSELLAMEAERLKLAIEGNGAAEREQRKKPRLKGK
jgi:hypothetical protein